MNVAEGFRQSFEVITGNKLRSLLTMLGIIFGVGCLIAISIVGGAFRASISGELGRFGSTLVWVQSNWEAYARGERHTFLDRDDIAFFDSSLAGLESAGTILDISETVVFEGASTPTRVYGVGPDHLTIFANDVARGRWFSTNDIRAMNRVCVLRPDIAQSLFEGADPIGKRIRVGSEVFTVIGVTKPLENPLLSDGSNNDTVFVPWELVARRVFGGGPPSYYVYLMRFESLQDVNDAVSRIRGYLDNRYGKLRELSRFRIDTSDQYISMVDNILDIVSTLVTVIASISLLVGGLGIMNIMLVTVTERTKEIGVRMAIGARRRDILSQFLIEAVVLCLLGGAVGTGFGALLAAVACSFLDWGFTIALQTVAIAVGVSSGIGLLFGTYPAHKASRLTPIEALRSER